MARKRDTVMLAGTYEDQDLTGFLASEKLDGLRCIWDGGVSRGMPASEVPWANTLKDARYRVPPVATGLWTRYFKTIQAPDDFLNQLPLIPLDGELFMGRGCFQQTASLVRSMDKTRSWEGVQLEVLDTPHLDIVFAPGEVRVNNGRTITIPGWTPWFEIEQCRLMNFIDRLDWLCDQGAFHVNQRFVESKDHAQTMLDDILDAGGEGVMFKAQGVPYVCKRSNSMLKWKPWLDDEALIVGYVSGKITEKDSRHRGRLGCLIVQWHGKVFEIGSGFTDEERDFQNQKAFTWCYDNPNQDVSGLDHPLFRVGDSVTFKYRELTDDGVPKEGRYWRKANDV